MQLKPALTLIATNGGQGAVHGCKTQRAQERGCVSAGAGTFNALFGTVATDFWISSLAPCFLRLLYCAVLRLFDARVCDAAQRFNAHHPRNVWSARVRAGRGSSPAGVYALPHLDCCLVYSA